LLSQILNEKKCFKLVCGAGNEDVKEVEKLVALYAKAGANFFDLCAKPEIVDAAKNGLRRVTSTENLKNYYLCVSVGIKGDPHIRKALINENCVACGNCLKVCPQNAIISGNKYDTNKIRCIGCGNCSKVCKTKAISFYSNNLPLDEVLPPLIAKGIDCIELHSIGTGEEEVLQKWETINNLFDGMLSICIDRSKLGNEEVLKRINSLILKKKNYSTIIQTDGSPMSGSNDDFKTTLQTIAMAEIIQNANLPVFVILAGGTNTKTNELAKLCDIKWNGIAVGSYARQIVREYIDREDFLENPEVFNKALEKAKLLVDSVLNRVAD
jgi:Fe-S-cluster-containing hydrogenase component 2